MLLGHGQLDEAEARFKRSLSAAGNGNEYRGKGAALEWLGITQRRRGDNARALEYFDQAEPFLDPARPRSMALLRMHRADALAGLDDQQAAMDGYRAAMGLFREHAAKARRDYDNEGKVLMGQAALLTDTDTGRARTLFREALVLFQAGDRGYQEAKAWEALGDLDNATDAWRAALALYERLRFQDDASRVREKLQAQ
jgi:tetratricopeptide (TPR) repeat protein